MNPASEPQLRRLAAHGKLEDVDYTKKEASEIISAIVESKEEPNWELADESRNLIWEIQTRQTKKAIRKLKKEITKEGISDEEKLDLTEGIEEYQKIVSDIEEEKEEWKESIREEKEDAKERIREYQAELGPYGEWTKYIKKPNQTQIKQCLEALDEQHPDWEMTKGTEALVATLIRNFPEVKKKNASTQKELQGCLSMIVVGFLVTIFIATKLMS